MATKKSGKIRRDKSVEGLGVSFEEFPSDSTLKANIPDAEGNWPKAEIYLKFWNSKAGGSSDAPNWTTYLTTGQFKTIVTALAKEVLDLNPEEEAKLRAELDDLKIDSAREGLTSIRLRKELGEATQKIEILNARLQEQYSQVDLTKVDEAKAKFWKDKIDPFINSPKVSLLGKMAMAVARRPSITAAELLDMFADELE